MVERPVSEAALEAVLAQAQAHKHIGPRPLQQHIEHARGFARAVGEAPDGLVVDLGSGGGLPALVLGLVWPTAHIRMVESHGPRARLLMEAVDELGWSDRLYVIEQRAELVARDPDVRGQADLVTSRGFGPPAVTAECAAPLLRAGGRLVVSDPPEDLASTDRWNAAGLALLGLEVEGQFQQPGGHYRIIRRASPCPDRYPRRVGLPAKRPLF